jgi:threonine dehydrogenase-like Zn-dependent dehydrogenase
MTDKLTKYKQADAPLPEKNLLWHLYGAGVENLGVERKPVEVAMQKIEPDQVLVRHDACGICFSDIKVINQGPSHPRIQRDMVREPVTLGHEVAMTIVQVGEKWKHKLKVGDRVAIQADIFYKGTNLSYGYFFQGGFSQYAVIDPRIIDSDYGNNLLPMKEGMGYAEAALAEPWACAVAAYRLKYRESIKSDGILWVIATNTPEGKKSNYSISRGFDSASHPSQLWLTGVPAELAENLKARAAKLGVPVSDVPDAHNPPAEFADDIILLGADPDLIETASPHLERFGIMAIMSQTRMPRKVKVDAGRVHYHRWLYTGSASSDITAAYSEVPVNANLKPGGTVWFVGAGGPLGRMHVQRAIQFPNPPGTIICTDVSDLRLEDLRASYRAEAEQNGIQFMCLNPTNKEQYESGMAPYFKDGIDTIVALAPIAPVIADAAIHNARNGVLNVFAGVVRGTMVDLELSDAYLKGVRVIGHSGSGMEDMVFTLKAAGDKKLDTNRSVAAVGSLGAVYDGVLAVKNATLPGKVVIYPNIKDLPLTPLNELKTSMPGVFAKLKDGREWTNEAEEEFLRLMLD